MNVNELIDILNTERPSEELLKKQDELFLLIPELAQCKGFAQNSPWHPYDVFDHIMHVVDNAPQNVVIRLAALFHDVGKPATYTEDENGVGHFLNHWTVSKDVFLEFAKKHNFSAEATKTIANLIYFHDVNFAKLSDEDTQKLVNVLSRKEVIMLFQLKKADLLAQSEKYHFLLAEYQKQEFKLVLKYNHDK